MHKSLSYLIFVPSLLMVSCADSIKEEWHPSVILSATQFQLIKDNIEFNGDNLFMLAIKEGMYERKGKEYLPGDKVGKFNAGGVIWYGSNGVGLVSYNITTKKYTVFNYPGGFIPGFHIRVIYADDEYVFFRHGYEQDFKPALIVYSTTKCRFMKISKITTCGGKFGSFSFITLKKYRPNSPGPSMTWDYSALKSMKYADLSKVHGLTGPTSIELTDSEYILKYNEDWKIDEFTTLLILNTNDIELQFDKSN